MINAKCGNLYLALIVYHSALIIEHSFRTLAPPILRMKLLSKLERTLAPYAVPNLTLGLIMVQGLVYFLATSRPAILIQALLVPELVLKGQLWRLVTFVAVPPATNLLFAFFFWYMFYLMGTAHREPMGCPALQCLPVAGLCGHGGRIVRVA